MRAGKYDRRIQIQVDIGTRDGSGDHVPNWSSEASDGAFKRWASQRSLRVREQEAAKAVLRSGDTEWTVRWDSQTSTIAPERMRVVHRGRIYEIVGVQDGARREDEIILTTAYRPDQRGDSAPIS